MPIPSLSTLHTVVAQNNIYLSKCEELRKIEQGEAFIVTTLKGGELVVVYCKPWDERGTSNQNRHFKDITIQRYDADEALIDELKFELIFEDIEDLILNKTSTAGDYIRAISRVAMGVEPEQAWVDTQSKRVDGKNYSSEYVLNGLKWIFANEDTNYPPWGPEEKRGRVMVLERFLELKYGVAAKLVTKRSKERGIPRRIDGVNYELADSLYSIYRQVDGDIPLGFYFGETQDKRPNSATINHRIVFAPRSSSRGLAISNLSKTIELEVICPKCIKTSQSTAEHFANSAVWKCPSCGETVVLSIALYSNARSMFRAIVNEPTAYRRL